jgi:hypothetical protein
MIIPRTNTDDCQWTVIEGLGGIGKMQVALEAAFQVRDTDKDCSVFWVPAVNMTMFENAYRDIGEALAVPGIMDDGVNIEVLVKTALKRSKAYWLLIINNIDDVELLAGEDSLRDYLPFN